MSQKVAHNILSLLTAKLLSMVLTFIGYAALLRYLGQYRTGQYQFVLSYVMLFSVVVDFGIQALVIKKVSEDPSQSKNYLGNFFAAELFLALFVYGLLSLIAWHNHYDPVVQKAIFVAGFGMFLNALSIPFTAIISAHQDMKVIAFVNFADSVINVGVMFGAILAKRGIAFIAAVTVLMGIMHFVVYSRIIRRYVPRLDLWSFISAPNLKLLRDLFKSALPFGLLVGFSIVYNKIDVIILQHLRNYSETGLYTAAYKFFDLMAFFPGIVSSSLYPYFSSQLQSGDKEAVRSTVQNYTRYMIAAAMPIAFGGILIAPRLITLLGGSEFYAGFTALQILVCATAVLFIYSAVNSLMINQLTRYAMVITLLNVFLNALGNYILIPRFGFRAAAMMTLASETFQALLYFYFVSSRIVKFKVMRFFVKPVFAAAVMSLALYGIRMDSVVLTIPVGAAVYAIVILLTGYFKKEDLDAIRRLVLRRQPVEIGENL